MIIFGDLWKVTLVKSLNQRLGANLHWSIVIYFFKIPTINVWGKQTPRPLVVERHLRLERKWGDNHSTNRVLKISEAY
jgi:hypothetical protein